MKQVKEMLDFIYNSPTAFHAVSNIKNKLLDNGFEELNEAKGFNLKKGGKYFVTRNGSSVVAFSVGKSVKNPSFNIVASHSDAPTYKVKPNAVIKQDGYVKLNTEMYGGAIANTWMDRPLSLAGRVVVKNNDGIKSELINFNRDLCMIINVAIHQNRMVNKGMEYNDQIDMLPVITSGDKFDLNEMIAKEIKCKKEDVLSFDLYLYPRTKGYIWGQNKEYISSYHLDNLECGYTSLVAFLNASDDRNINVYACFDNEEVGSVTRQGAASTLLIDVLKRISNGLSFDLDQALASSVLISADNAHAVSPSHPEKADPTNRVLMNNGIVIKYNANQSYTTDSISAALFNECAKKANVKTQYFTNRSDARGGGTLGNISSSHVSIASCDIGLAQLAMHSAFETSGTKDVEYMINGLKSFYETHFIQVEEGVYKIQ